MRGRVVYFILLGLVVALARGAWGQRTASKQPPAKSRRAARPMPVVPGPAAPVGTVPLLPRFWQLADSADRADAVEVFNAYLGHFIQYPARALQAGVGGTIYARLTVQPDGRVGSIAVTRRDLGTTSPPIKAVMALDAELQRVAWQLRFKPAPARLDSTDVAEDASLTISTDSTNEVDVTEARSLRVLPDTVTIYHRFMAPAARAER